MSQLAPFLTDEELPPSRNRQSRVRKAAMVLALLAVAATFGGFLVVARSIGRTETQAASQQSGPVTVIVEQGDSLTEIGTKLRDAGVVVTAETFVLAAESDQRSQGIGPGTYTLRQGLSGRDALALMLDPAARKVETLVIREGMTAKETITEAVKITGIPRTDFQEILNDPAALEGLGLPTWADGEAAGFLFPATYDLGPDATASSILGSMFRRFNEVATDMNLRRRAERAGLKPYDVVTIASLAEAEVKPDDFPRATRTILNRLEAGLRLQLDSTVNFVLGTKDLIFTEEQMQVDSPYNTYVIDGLPPTPINSPGQDALEAVLSPEPGSWLYFVTTDADAGITEFTSDYDRFMELRQQLRDAAGLD